jgi:hypothetical protein
VSYDTLRRFAMQQLGWRQQAPTVRVDDPPPGQEAQVDFGKMGPMLDPDTGRVRSLWALIITLSFSRYQFVWPTFLQTTETVCEGLDRAWAFFAAMIRTIVPDNMSAIVKTPDALSPILVTAFSTTCRRAASSWTQRVSLSEDKPRVENQVPYVRESWFDGETFTDSSTRSRAPRPGAATSPARAYHGTTRAVPRELFESTEKARHAPGSRRALRRAALGREGQGASRPPHPGRARPLLGPLAPPQQDGPRPRRQDDSEDLRGHGPHQDAPAPAPRRALHRPERLPRRARPTTPFAASTRCGLGLAPRARTSASTPSGCSGDPLPWTRMRAAYALLRLCDKYGDGRVEAVCQSALAFDVVDVARITRMLKAAAKPASPTSHDGKRRAAPAASLRPSRRALRDARRPSKKEGV